MFFTPQAKGQGRDLKNAHFFAGGVVRPLQDVPRPLPKISVVGRRKEPLPSLPNRKSRSR